MGDRVYLQEHSRQRRDITGTRDVLQRRHRQTLWEHRFNIYLSDVPPHRIGWASPVGDPSTGNVYVFGVGGN